MIYDLPEALTVGGIARPIRSDYRAVMDVCAVIADPELTETEKTEGVLTIMYEDLDAIPFDAYKEAMEQAMWFVAGGDDDTPKKRGPKLVDWEQDFRFIIAPINHIIGKDIRSLPALHWWTFLAAYYEIGDCVFAQIVRIRTKRAKGKKLDKDEREWYRDNRKLVDFKMRFTSEDDKVMAAWGIK